MPDIIKWERVGRPSLYTDPKEMQKDIQEYFDSCWQYKFNKDGEVIVDEYGNPIWMQSKPYTMSGLARAIGMDRRTLLNYKKKDEFFPTIQEARKKIEEYAESRLYDRDGSRGAIFNLQNNFKGWEDKKKVENEHEFKNSPADELLKSIDDLKQKK